MDTAEIDAGTAAAVTSYEEQLQTLYGLMADKAREQDAPMGFNAWQKAAIEFMSPAGEL